MKKNVAIGALLVVVLYLMIVLIRVENQRYALFVGMCRSGPTGLADSKCLSKVETRTNPLWHLFYALID